VTRTVAPLGARPSVNETGTAAGSVAEQQETLTISCQEGIEKHGGC
jgi:hypothetical protein